MTEPRKEADLSLAEAIKRLKILVLDTREMSVRAEALLAAMKAHRGER